MGDLWIRIRALVLAFDRLTTHGCLDLVRIGKLFVPPNSIDLTSTSGLLHTYSYFSQAHLLGAEVDLIRR